MDQKLIFDLQGAFLVGNLNFSTKIGFEACRDHLWANFCRKMYFRFFDQKSILTSSVNFWSKNLIFNFLTKNRFQASRDNFWVNFCQNWNFGFLIKNRFSTSRVHFLSKNGILDFRPKIDLRPLGLILGLFCLASWTFDYFDQKSIFDPQGQYLVEKWSC